MQSWQQAFGRSDIITAERQRADEYIPGSQAQIPALQLNAPIIGDVPACGQQHVQDIALECDQRVARTGVTVTPTNQGIRIARNGGSLAPVEVTTAPFPEFPTDLQAQLMALMTRARGTSHIVETVFENRFMHVQELARLGARIHLDGERATIEGVESLKGAPVMATDLRASVSLVIAALAAEGETIVNRVYHLDRGFERLEDKLGRCGAAIERLSG